MSKNLNKDQIPIKTLQAEINSTTNVHGFCEELKTEYRLFCNSSYNRLYLKPPERTHIIQKAKKLIKSYNANLLSQNKKKYILQIASNSEINEKSSLNIIVNQVDKLSKLKVRPLKRLRQT